MKKLIKKLTKCPQDRHLFMVWVVKEKVYGLDQIHTHYKIYMGSWVLLTWLHIYTPVADWKH